MRQWWESLAKREQQIILLGGLIVIVFIIYQFIIMPIHNGLNNMRATVQQDQQLLQWMHTTSQKITALQGGSVSGKQVGSETILTTIAQSVHSSPIASNLTSIQQNANNTVDVKFSSVSFDALTQWLADIRQHYGIQAKQVLITRINDHGMVQASITLQAGNV